MVTRETTIRLFLRVADQRLTTAAFLLENDFTLDAIYLAGYAVECSLKALALNWSPRKKFESTLARLTKTGARGHDFEYLMGILRRSKGRTRRQQAESDSLTALVRDVQHWTTGIRYETGSRTTREAEVFIRSTRAIRDLCRRS